MKLAVVVGHNSTAQGAVRPDTGETEYVFNGRLSQKMERLGPEWGLEVRVFRRKPGGGYSKEIQRVYDEVDAWGAEASIELHFNSAGSGATGTETLTSGTALSMVLAQEINDEIVIALGLADRGVKTRTSNERGYKSLISGKAPAVLVEPFFGSSLLGQRATDEDHEQEALAAAILRGASRAMATFPRSNLEASRTLKATSQQRKGSQIGVVAGTGAIVTTVAESLVQDSTTLPEAIGHASQLAQYLPVATKVLIILAILAFIYLRHKSDKIEEARVDDFERRVR